MARNRKPSDDVWNARRKAQRLLNKLEKKTQNNVVSEIELKEYQKKVSELQSQIKNFKYDRKTKQYPTSITAFKQAVTTKIKSTFVDYMEYRNTNKRNDQITKMQETKFRSKDDFTRWGAHVFYRYTQNLWDDEHTTPENRNNKIVDEMKNNNVMLSNGNLVENLSDAYKYVQEQMSGDFKDMRRYYDLLDKVDDNGNLDLTDEALEFMDAMFTKEEEDMTYSTFLPVVF